MKKDSREKVKEISLLILLGPLLLLRELFLSYEKNEKTGNYIYKFNTRKLWATTFCTPFAIAIWIRVCEAWKIFNSIYDKIKPEDDLIEKLKPVIAIIQTSPMAQVLGTELIATLGGFAMTAVGWYTWDKHSRRSLENNSEE